MKNNKLKILVIGASGQIGGVLMDILGKNKGFEVLGADKISKKPGNSLDITKKSEVSRFLGKKKPNVVILTAAFTDVDGCEDQKDFAYNINVRGAENVILACKENLAKLIYFSTAYVFDGKKGNYKEEDKTNPINVYAKTKLEAERIIQRELNDYLIIRTNWVFDLGYDQKNFIFRLINNLKEKKSMRVPDDQYGNPTLARNIAWAVEKLIQSNRKGIYNIVGTDKMTKYQWAKRVAQYFKLKDRLIIPISTMDLKQKAKRPLKDDLNINKIKKDIGNVMIPLDKSLGLIKERIKQ